MVKVGVSRGEEEKKKRLSRGEGWGFPRGRREKKGRVAGKVGVSCGEEEKKSG